MTTAMLSLKGQEINKWAVDRSISNSGDNVNLKILGLRKGNCLGISVIFTGCLMIAGGCGKKEEAKPEVRPTEVYVVKVEPRDTPVSFQYVAQTQSSHQVEIRARVNGFLDRRVYTEGSTVKAGQVLFLMDKKPFEAQVADAKAALARQTAALDTARANLDRVKPLVEQNALSKKQLDDSTGVYESYAAAVEQAKAQLTEAELNLSYCTITAPVDGITGAALLQDGAYINAQNSQLTTVSALSPMWVNFSISQQEMQSFRDQIAKGLIIAPKDGNYEVEVINPDGSVFPRKGRITFTAPLYNPQTGTFLLRVTLDNPGGVLRPFQYVQVRLNGAVRPNAILVPQRAVQQGAKGHTVWVVTKDNKAESRPVVVGDWYRDDWFITEGLRAGDQVVVDGGLGLQAGAVVAPKPLSAEKPIAPVVGTPSEKAPDKSN